MNVKGLRQAAASFASVALAALFILAGGDASAQPQTTTPDAGTTTPAATDTTVPVTAAPGTEAVPGAPADGTAQPMATAPATEGEQPPAGETGETTEQENPYGLSALWGQGNIISRGTLVVLLIMSIGTWYLFFTKYLEQGRILKHARTADNKFWRAANFDEAVAQLERSSAFRMIVEDGQAAAQQHASTLSAQIDLNDWVQMALNRSADTVNSKLQSGLAFLASVGSTAPFVGLFGTVYGIYNALIAIGVSGQASIDRVAGPVGEALIMTAFGLVVAVPAVLFYNLLVRRNKVVMDRVRSFTADVHGFLLGARAKRS